MATQTEIPGTERKRVKAIENAAAKYKAVRDQRMELTREEVKLREKLAEVMREHGERLYVSEDLELEVELIPGKEKVKVRKHDEDDEAEE